MSLFVSKTRAWRHLIIVMIIQHWEKHQNFNLKDRSHLLTNKGDRLEHRSERKLKIEIVKKNFTFWMFETKLTTTTEKSNLFLSSSALDNSFNSSKASRVSSLRIRG